MAIGFAAQPSSLQSIGPGYLLDGRYRLDEPIGQGAMGVVYEATHVLLNRKVAVKIIGTGTQMSDAALQRMAKEGQNLAQVVHPHVVGVSDFGFTNNLAYLVMELLTGESLDDRMRRTGKLDIEVALSIVRQVLRGLSAAHGRGIVHRDLKPANIFLIETTDGWPHAKIIDFGISTQGGKKDSRPNIAGTPSYLPPEQARGESVDGRADLYALGATLFEMLTGRPPFVAKNLPSLLAAIQLDAAPPPSTLRRDLTDGIDRIILKALSKNREERFASPDEMLAELEELRAGSPKSKRAYILVADSNPSSSATSCRLASSMGRVALAVRGGLEAREAMATRGLPELLIVNLSLSGIDGLTLLAELQEESNAKGVPAIVASKIPSLRMAATAARDALGITAVLTDLADEEQLGGAMRAVLVGDPRPPAEPTTEVSVSEMRRLAKIRRLRLGDDTPPQESLQRFVAEVAHAFRVPTALVSIVLEDKQWFQAYSGIGGKFLEDRGTPREAAFCDHAVAGSSRLLVPDAKAHPVFRDNPYVLDGSVGGYAGAPLITPTGEVLGTLCIIDQKPLSVSPEMLDALDVLARRVAGELEVFGQTMDAGNTVSPPESARPSSPAISSDALTMELDPVSVEGSFADPMCAALLLDSERRILRASEGLRRLFGVAPEDVVGLSRDEIVERLSQSFVDPVAFKHAVRVLPEGPFAGRSALRLRPRDGEKRPRPALWLASPVHTPTGMQQLEVYRYAPPGSAVFSAA